MARNTQSLVDSRSEVGFIATVAIIGVSSDVLTSDEDDPKWVQSGRPHSEAASKTGSQYRPRSWCSDGRPSGAGFSLNDTAFAPRSAQRRISAAASRGAPSGVITRGVQ